MKQKKESGFSIIMGLIVLIKPLLGMMFLAILLGCIGNLMAMFITILGGYGFLSVMGSSDHISLSVIIMLILLCACFRGVLRYGEQASNHYIAFKLLARIRHLVFDVLRKLAPAKLDGSEKGNLIAIITSDIELLEVFYAHTISPIAIAFLTSVIMSLFIGFLNPWLGVMAAICYSIVGMIIPMNNRNKGKEKGQEFRDAFGNLNTLVLDNLYGLDEIIQYQQEKSRQQKMHDKTACLEQVSKELKIGENMQRIMTDSTILFAGVLFSMVVGILYLNGSISVEAGVIAVITIMSSFGPTAALAALSNNLHHTLASGKRVLSLLKEEPITNEISDGEESCQGDISCDKVSFGYEKDDRYILEEFTQKFEPNKIYGILGKSGCGKSTLLKLLMRFYEAGYGSISFGSHDVNHIKTSALRNHVSYVTQETNLFEDTIENNIKVAKENATRNEVIEAAKKASIHEFILSLPNGYDTKLVELGESVSGGERQRIGLARAFLHDSKVILLDEPTSNVDSLNESIILKSLKECKTDKIIILVSHRKSTLRIADEMISL